MVTVNARYGRPLASRIQVDITALPKSAKRLHHSITSSARPSSVAGSSRPSVFAVLKLTTSSSFRQVYLNPKKHGENPVHDAAQLLAKLGQERHHHSTPLAAEDGICQR